MQTLLKSLKSSNPGALSVLQSMVNYLFIIDFRGKILLTSQSVPEDTKNPQSFYEDKLFSDCIEDPNHKFNLLENLLFSEDKKNIELELKTKEGPSIPVMLLSTTLLKEFYKSEDLIFILCTDLRMQKKAQMTLLQSSKMASLGEMSSSLAHELNNPLTIIEGQLRRLKDYVYDEDITKEETSELISKAQRNLGRAVKIIRSFRSISRKDDNDPFEFISINELIAEINELTHQRLEKNNIEFKVLCSKDDLRFSCRKPSILQVFINLINNAIDALENIEQKWIRLHVITNEEKIIFTIMDSGAGISFENQVKLFEPFFTTKDIGKGTGLGLSISRNIVEQHSGTLIYTDKMNHSCFILTLPLEKN